MDISVLGTRAGSSDWEAVRNLSREELPALTPEQLEVARKLGASEEDYARSVLAGERTREKLLAKTEQLARFLQRGLMGREAQAVVQSVLLDTWEGRFEVSLDVGGRSVPVHIAESLVDDLFETGSEESEERLIKILDVALGARVA